MLGNVMPSCIIEFTATPARTKMPSNVLHYVSAAELKAADMVKLPLKVVTRHPSQKDQLLTEALTLRADLERLATAEAQATGEYLRPILLIQAVRVDDCEELRTRLTTDFGVPKEQIKIATGIRFWVIASGLRIIDKPATNKTTAKPVLIKASGNESEMDENPTLVINPIAQITIASR